MVLIPPDAAIRMRMQTEANLLQPVTPTHKISSDLPELQKGQQFTAHIREALPDNTYRALVAGKQLTLQLPEGAKPGDLLELVVIDRSAKAIVARQVDGGPANAAAAAPYLFAKLSPAGRMIGQLLPAEGESAQPAQLNRGQPLLAQPPQSQAATILLAPTLARAVTQSGLFYEAHQAQWVAGKLPLAQLLLEPQGQRSSPAAFQHAAAEVAARAIGTAERPVTANTVLQALQTGNEKVGAGGTASAGSAVLMGTAPAGSAALLGTAPAVGLAQQIPDGLRPLVQQQLEAAATQRMLWHGEVWPRQSMDWEIERDTERQAGDGSGDEDALWRTTLSLTTPRLGRVEANLQLTLKGVSITLATPGGTSAADLRDAAPQLAEALAAAGVPLLALQVNTANEQPAR
ncbi:MAG: flagellar hook-length control protein FliK [Rhodocyclaceae bacterium]|nr:flagellar hook-length control protein FliK [Rhodocyclaceae bacterium]